MKVVIVTQARMGSSRLPGKVLKTAGGKSFLEIHLERASRASRVSDVIVATSQKPADDPIVLCAEKSGVQCFRGAELDVLDRFYRAARSCGADAVVRLTADCPLIDPAVIDRVVAAFIEQKVDYASNVQPPTFPDGLDVEVISFPALEQAWSSFGIPADRHHVTRFVRESSDLAGQSRFRACNVRNGEDLSGFRLTLDTEADLELLTHLVERVGCDAPFMRYVDHLRAAPELAARNRAPRDSSYHAEVARQLAEEERRQSFRFTESERYLDEVSQVIPLGSQTFSKSKVQFPHGAAPFFLTHGKGSAVWDLDGNRYIDYSSSLLAITLGYADADINAAVAAQLEKGTIFSLPHPLEHEVAKLICEMVPCAEMVRFGKNGSDATSAAIRVARAYTKRDHVLVCGYHGWQDWYIGSTARHLGVPDAVRALTHTFKYNDIDSLRSLCDSLGDNVAAVILEPVNIEPPRTNFLEDVRTLTRERGIVLVFDEVITGFRFARGGAQELFGVTPDLAAFGKGLANGFPLSAIAGRADIMALMEQIFFSTTYGGETVSLAAAKANLTKVKNEPILERIHGTGQRVMAGLRRLIDSHALGDVFHVQGYPPWSFMSLKPIPEVTPDELRTIHIQEMIRSGILMTVSHNISCAHTDEDVDALFSAYDHLFGMVSWGLSRGRLKECVRGRVLQPLFRVR